MTKETTFTFTESLCIYSLVYSIHIFEHIPQSLKSEFFGFTPKDKFSILIGVYCLENQV